MAAQLDLLLAEQIMTVELARTSAFIGLVAELSALEYQTHSPAPDFWADICRGLMLPVSLTLSVECASEPLLRSFFGRHLFPVLVRSIQEIFDVVGQLSALRAGQNRPALSTIRSISAIADLIEVGLAYSRQRPDPSVGSFNSGPPSTAQTLKMFAHLDEVGAVFQRLALLGYCTLWRPKLAGRVRKMLRPQMPRVSLRDGSKTVNDGTAEGRLREIWEMIRFPEWWRGRNPAERSARVERLVGVPAT